MAIVSVKKNRDAGLRHLLSSLGLHFKPSGDKLQILTWTGQAIRSAIAECISYPNTLDHSEFLVCVGAATRQAILSNDYTDSFLLLTVEKEIREVIRQSKTRYTCWTMLSLPGRKKAEVINFLGQKVTIGSKPPRYSTWFDDAFANGDSEKMPDLGVYAKISGEFRNLMVAGNQLTTDLERFAAFLNVANNSWSGLVFPHEARAHFQVGPSFYLLNHETNKYESGTWTNVAYSESRWRYPHKAEELYKNGKKLISQVGRVRSRNPLYQDIVFCIEYLSSSWVQRMPQAAIMQLWSCFERLFCSSGEIGKSGVDLISRRAAKFDKDSVTRYEIMYCLGNYRNMAAHHAGSPGLENNGLEFYRESIKYMIWLINWALRFGAKFSSKQEFLDWVDIPKDKERILYRKRINQLAMTFWHKN